MINTLRIYDDLKETMEPDAARKITQVFTLIYEDLQNTVTKVEFNELKAVVQKLADAQEQTEFNVKELSQAQARTELQVKELAQAQARTEDAVKALARQVGGLSEKLGGSLEDLSYDVLPACIEKYYQIEVGELGREFVEINGREIEFNVFGQGTEKATGKKLTIIGEVKSNITEKEVKDFVRVLNMARKAMTEEIFPVLFGFRIRLDARELAKANDIRMFVSYGKEIK